MSCSRLVRPVFTAIVSLGMLLVMALVPAVSQAEGPSALGKCTTSDRVLVRDNNKIVVLGTTDSCKNYNASGFVAQFNPDGTVDTGWAAGGIALFSSSAIGPVSGFELTADGGVVVATPSQFFKLGADGFRVSDFNSPPTDILIRSMATDAVGNLIVQGSTGSVPQLLRRYTPEGNQDMTFAGDGEAEVALSSDILAIAPSGDIYAGLGRGVASVTKYDPSGTIDPTYGPDGNGTARLSASQTAPVDSTFEFETLSTDGAGRTTASGSVTFCGACESMSSRAPKFVTVGFKEILDAEGDPVQMPLGGYSGDQVPVAFDGSGAYLGIIPRLERYFSAYGLFTFRFDPDDGMTGNNNVFVGPGRSVATDAAFASADEAIVVGTAQSSSRCTSIGCPTSMVISKSNLARQGPSSGGFLVDSFGDDKGVTVLPKIKCPHGKGAKGPIVSTEFRSYCRIKLKRIKAKVRFTKGAGRRPGVVLSAKLPARAPNLIDTTVGVTSRDVTIKLPRGLRVRKSLKRKASAKINDGVEPDVRVRGKSLELEFESSLETPKINSDGRRLKVRIRPGALKPLKKGQLKRRMKFGMKVLYKTYDRPPEFGSGAAKARPVKRRG